MKKFTLTPEMYELQKFESIGRLIGQRIRQTIGDYGRDTKNNIKSGGKDGIKAGKEVFLGVIDHIKGNPSGFANKLFTKTGLAEPLLDIPSGVLRQGLSGNPALQKMIVKEAMLWTALPYASMNLAWALGMSTIVGLFFKSAAWFAVVDQIERHKKRKEAKGHMSLNDAIQAITFAMQRMERGPQWKAI